MQDFLAPIRPMVPLITVPRRSEDNIPSCSFTPPPTVLIQFILIFSLIWFLQLNWRHLIPSDEGRYAEMAREMLVTGDWITPRYNGYKYFEKPPLQTWFNAVTFALFGVGDWQARFYTALCGFAGILLVGYTGLRVLNQSAGLMAALVLASSPYWNLISHLNVLDTGLAFWMELTLCSLLLAQRVDLPEHLRRRWMWLCWASMALAVLSKGLIGLILPGASLVIYTVVARDWAVWKRLHSVSGALIFLGIVLPWFVLVQLKNPEFFYYFFIIQQFERYLTPAQNRPGPFYYFVGVMLVGFLPWASVAAQSIRQGWRIPHQQNGFAPVILLLVWSIFIFLFFSASHSKLTSYTLPVAPALALVIGLYLPRVTREQWQRHLLGYMLFLTIASIVAYLALVNRGDVQTPNALYLEFVIWVEIAIGVSFALTLIALWLLRLRTDPAMSIVVFGIGWFLLGAIGGNGHEVFGRQSSGALLAPAIQAELAKLPPDTPFYSVNMLDHTLPFYVRHVTIMVQNADELQFGAMLEKTKWIPTINQWRAQWRGPGAALALLPSILYGQLASAGMPMKVIACDARRVIVTKP
ncbi:glycosyltransferase family 39 protein [Candidatus Vallotia tarda]|uniref:Glycosyltransferase family 39 protein n=1 Tax=Candidatus Vallotiella hemipterorum TaxID=1177213 RepID=A0A916NMK0_9BURK|nr:glycosyltransferase family 39 protein [Candidatus Vallotia tarda]CAG7602502.1 Glycosyltransferase family 39 protein [Candidatus Vallotia tarda]